MSAEGLEPRETAIASWSNVCPTTTRLVECADGSLPPDAGEGKFVIPRGAGRSFGDAAYVTRGTTLSSLRMARLGAVAAASRVVTCEAGVRMVDLHRHVAESGYSFGAYGGTPWATVGGAAASDIHGKSDWTDGSFGNHVQSMTVVVPDGGEIECSRSKHPDLFAATIGGMGLTGFIKSVTVQLDPKRRRAVRVRARVVSSLREMIDCFAGLGADMMVCDWLSPSIPSARGIFWYGSYVDGDVEPRGAATHVWLPRIKVFNRWTVRAMGIALQAFSKDLDVVRHVREFNYGGGHALLVNWNRLFGKRGFIEYHFALDEARFADGYRTLASMARERSVDLFFGVVKRLGAVRREGLLSFPMPGYGMNFQLEDTPEARRLLLAFTDALVQLGGRVYLAKDAVILPRHLEAMYADLGAWRRIVKTYDARGRIQSDLSMRLRMKP